VIITRTPLRISFVGGGTDLPGYYRFHGGQVISTTIDKYVYVTISEKFDGRVNLRYSETEDVGHVDELKHDIVRECLKHFGITNGVEIVTISDVPMRGTGLGSSSALTVGLLRALSEYTHQKLSLDVLADTACGIEIEKVGSPIGKQDQYAAAFGGFNHIEFGSADAVGVFGMNAPRKIRWLENASMLFHLDRTRSANDILSKQSEEIGERLPIYSAMSTAVDWMREWLNDETPCEEVGEIIDQEWDRKKQLGNGISDDEIDVLYCTAKMAGALGGKVAGAGGGGFMLLIVPDEAKDAVREVMAPLHEMPFRFSTQGSEVIYADS